MRFIIILVGITALAACDRSISETGSNASTDAQQLGAIKAGDHSREATIATGTGQGTTSSPVVAVTPPAVQH